MDPFWDQGVAGAYVGRRQGTPWTGCLSVAGPHIYTLTDHMQPMKHDFGLSQIRHCPVRREVYFLWQFIKDPHSFLPKSWNIGWKKRKAAPIIVLPVNPFMWCSFVIGNLHLFIGHHQLHWEQGRSSMDQRWIFESSKTKKEKGTWLQTIWHSDIISRTESQEPEVQVSSPSPLFWWKIILFFHPKTLN